MSASSSSTEDNLTSINTDNQNALDAIPTSSTDANTGFVNTETATEDPISSTSSEMYSSKNEYLDDEVEQFAGELSASDINLIIMGQSTPVVKKTYIEPDEEFLNLNVANESDNKITEDVEDIVHDLENLLGESASSSYSASAKSAETSVNVAGEETLQIQEIDKISAEENLPLKAENPEQLPHLQEKKSAPKVATAGLEENLSLPILNDDVIIPENLQPIDNDIVPKLDITNAIGIEEIETEVVEICPTAEVIDNEENMETEVEIPEAMDVIAETADIIPEIADVIPEVTDILPEIADVAMAEENMDKMEMEGGSIQQTELAEVLTEPEEKIKLDVEIPTPTADIFNVADDLDLPIASEALSEIESQTSLELGKDESVQIPLNKKSPQKVRLVRSPIHTSVNVEIKEKITEEEKVSVSEEINTVEVNQEASLLIKTEETKPGETKEASENIPEKVTEAEVAKSKEINTGEENLETNKDEVEMAKSEKIETVEEIKEVNEDIPEEAVVEKSKSVNAEEEKEEVNDHLSDRTTERNEDVSSVLEETATMQPASTEKVEEIVEEVSSVVQETAAIEQENVEKTEDIAEEDSAIVEDSATIETDNITDQVGNIAQEIPLVVEETTTIEVENTKNNAEMEEQVSSAMEESGNTEKINEMMEEFSSGVEESAAIEPEHNEDNEEVAEEVSSVVEESSIIVEENSASNERIAAEVSSVVEETSIIEEENSASNEKIAEEVSLVVRETATFEMEISVNNEETVEDVEETCTIEPENIPNKEEIAEISLIVEDSNINKTENTDENKVEQIVTETTDKVQEIDEEVQNKEAVCDIQQSPKELEMESGNERSEIVEESIQNADASEEIGQESLQNEVVLQEVEESEQKSIQNDIELKENEEVGQENVLNDVEEIAEEIIRNDVESKQIEETNQESIQNEVILQEVKEMDQESIQNNVESEEIEKIPQKNIQNEDLSEEFKENVPHQDESDEGKQIIHESNDNECGSEGIEEMPRLFLEDEEEKYSPANTEEADDESEKGVETESVPIHEITDLNLQTLGQETQKAEDVTEKEEIRQGEEATLKDIQESLDVETALNESIEDALELPVSQTTDEKSEVCDETENKDAVISIQVQKNSPAQNLAVVSEEIPESFEEKVPLDKEMLEVQKTDKVLEEQFAVVEKKSKSDGGKRKEISAEIVEESQANSLCKQETVHAENVDVIPASEDTKLPQEHSQLVNPQPEVSSLLLKKVDMLDSDLKSTLTVDIDEEVEEIQHDTRSMAEEKVPEEDKNLLKITITKQADSTHSIMKTCSPSEASHIAKAHSPVPRTSSPRSSRQVYSPKVTIKPIVKPEMSPLKITIKPLQKPDECEQKSSPKLTIKPIIKPDEISDKHRQKSSPKLTIKPILKPEEVEEEHSRQKSSPKVTIKPIAKPEEPTVPKLTIKPIVKPEESLHSPKITIKPVVKPEEEPEQHYSPRIIIKSPVKPADIEEPCVEEVLTQKHEGSPKITIKPIVKPPDVELIDFEEEIKQERIILKINKNTLPPSRKRDHSEEGDKSEKLAKIKVKYSKEGGHACIVPSVEAAAKHSLPDEETECRKRFKLDNLNIPQGVTITNIEPTQTSKLKDILNAPQKSPQEPHRDLKIEPVQMDDGSAMSGYPVTPKVESKDPLSEIPVFEITPQTVITVAATTPSTTSPQVATTSTPRKRGRPRKVPLEVREEFKDAKEDEVVVIEDQPKEESSRPKRSCRGPSARTTLGIKPRKPRGPGRGRGGKRGMGTRGGGAAKSPKEPKVTSAKVKEEIEEVPDKLCIEDTFSKDSEPTFSKDSEPTFSKDSEPTFSKESEPSTSSTILPELAEVSSDVVIYEEETRMSAEASSRAQTPAKQVIQVSTPAVEIEESQSSVQSSATSESVKVRKGPRLEVHQEPEGAVISADQLAEYSWGGGGPYMLQEQVAQFLGIKSFKRKYPGINRRPVDMQERDFIRESGLASEAMCDLGLTAVNSADILDIMYSDFQPKYEEYCKHQRDRQAKDLINKQKALSLAASQEKNKLDITEQAVQSAASWNANFNKARREERKACMDLQTFTIHFPKGKIKQISKPRVGNYPVALVPGQFTDYYKTFSPTELNNLPINTMGYDPVPRIQDDDSQSDGSGSDSDSSSSDSDSSDSGSSGAENCTVCSSRPKQQISIR